MRTGHIRRTTLRERRQKCNLDWTYGPVPQQSTILAPLEITTALYPNSEPNIRLQVPDIYHGNNQELRLLEILPSLAASSQHLRVKEPLENLHTSITTRNLGDPIWAQQTGISSILFTVIYLPWKGRQGRPVSPNLLRDCRKVPEVLCHSRES